MSIETNADNRKKLKHFGVIGGIVVAIGAIFTLLYLRYKKSIPKDKIIQKQLFPKGMQGLTNEEAEKRQEIKTENIISVKPKRDRDTIIRNNVFSIFNYTMVGMALIQLAFRKPLDALMTLGVIIFNISVNIAQELIALKRLEKVFEENKPTATVIRDGKTKSIDVNEIVVGDLVVVGPGDALYVDGKIVAKSEIEIDESMVGEGWGVTKKGKGDRIYAGSVCLSGRTIYIVEKVGADRVITKNLMPSEELKVEYTPIERILRGILKSLIVVMVVVLIFFGLRLRSLPVEFPVEGILDAVGVIFSIAPTSLFFMVVLTYVASTSDLARLGALVTQSRDVEELANVNEICFAQDGILTGTRPVISNISEEVTKDELSKARFRHILGDFAESLSTNNQIIRSLTADFEGSGRNVFDKMEYLSAYGWCAVVFNDDDLKGTYVLGESEVLKYYLMDEGGEKGLTKGEKKSSVWGKLFGGKKRAQQHKTEDDTNREPEKSDGDKISIHKNNEVIEAKEDNSVEETQKKKSGRLSRLVARARRLIPVRPREKSGETENKPDVQGLKTYIFAYTDEVDHIRFEDNKPTIPNNLRPIVNIHFTKKVREDTVGVIKDFSRNGVRVKVFAKDDVDEIINLLQKAEIPGVDQYTKKAITEEELLELEPKEFQQAAVENSVFVDLSPLNSALVVRSLRNRGNFVAVVGDRIGDVPSMEQANLAIAMQSSNQVARNEASIILLKDSISVLEKVLIKGQRILNGLINILKINLTQIFYVLMLVVAVPIFSKGFPFLSSHLTVVTVVTIAIPSVALTLLAKPGITDSRSILKGLLTFVIPVSIAISVVGLRVYNHFRLSTESMAYAQLSLMYAVVFMGLILILFVNPPRLDRKHPVSAWPLVFVPILFALFMVFVKIPLAQRFLKVKPLNSVEDLRYVLAEVGLWTILMLLYYLGMKMAIRIRKGFH